VQNLFADAAAGKPATDQSVAAQLDQAQQKLQAGG
jgi:multiple sugar transport system substrate-binding protein